MHLSPAASASSANKPHRQVGVAVIWDERRDRILIDRRLATGDFAGYWEFPGGKFEPGEDAVACIQREIREELGIEVEVGERLIAIEHEYDTKCVTLIVHHCTHRAGEPQALECAEVRWVSLADLDRYRFPAANGAILAALRQEHRHE